MKPEDTSAHTSLEVLPPDEAGELLDFSPEERFFHKINLLRIEGYCFSFDPKNSSKRTGKQEFLELVKMPEGAVSRPISVEPHPPHGYPSTLPYKILSACLKKV